MKAKILLFSVISLSLSLESSISHAADDKTYSAVECVANSGDLVYSQGRAYNNSSTSSLGVWCPIINDEMASSIDSAWVKVYDSSASENFDCSIRSRYQSGYSLVGFWDSASSSYEGPQTINFGSLSGTGSNYTYHMVCEIPPKEDGDRSYIMLYHVEEG